MPEAAAWEAIDLVGNVTLLVSKRVYVTHPPPSPSQNTGGRGAWHGLVCAAEPAGVLHERSQVGHRQPVPPPSAPMHLTTPTQKGVACN
jgi:hypothetical protein